MQAVKEDEIETIHLYVVREEGKRPFTAFPLLCAFLCLVGIVWVTLSSAQYPYYEHQQLTVPAQFLPRQTFTAAAPIIPTGIKTYPATAAHGVLTLTNGSVVTQELPQGMIFGGSGIEVITDAAVIVPAGSAAGYGMATVPARAVVSGTQGNIKAFAINAVYGTSLYIRNLTAFHGGEDAYSVKVVTLQDRQTALNVATAFLKVQKAHIHAFLVFPCKETIQSTNSVVGLSWDCQFAIYSIPSDMKVTHVRLVGKHFLVDVVFVPRPHVYMGK